MVTLPLECVETWTMCYYDPNPLIGVKSILPSASMETTYEHHYFY